MTISVRWATQPKFTPCGLNWNLALETGGVLVGKRIKLELEVQALPRSAVEAA